MRKAGRETQWLQVLKNFPRRRNNAKTRLASRTEAKTASNSRETKPRSFAYLALSCPSLRSSGDADPHPASVSRLAPPLPEQKRANPIAPPLWRHRGVPRGGEGDWRICRSQWLDRFLAPGGADGTNPPRRQSENFANRGWETSWKCQGLSAGLKMEGWKTPNDGRRVRIASVWL